MATTTERPPDPGTFETLAAAKEAAARLKVAVRNAPRPVDEYVHVEGRRGHGCQFAVIVVRSRDRMRFECSNELMAFEAAELA